MAALLFALFGSRVAHAFPSCAPGSIYPLGAEYPMLSVFSLTSPAPVSVSSVQSIIQDSCRPGLQSNGPNFNAFIRSHMRIVYSSAPANATYEVQVYTVSNTGVETLRGTSTRQLRAGISDQNPQTDYFVTYATNLLGGSSYGYGVRTKVRLIGTGEIRIAYLQTAAHGSAVAHGYATNSSTSLSLTTTWQAIGTLQFTTGASPSDVQVQARLNIQSGTPGTRMTVGFTRNGSNPDGQALPHTFEIYVPSELPDEVAIMDSLPNEGVGDPYFAANTSHTVTLWGKTAVGTVMLASTSSSLLAFPTITGHTVLSYASRLSDKIVSTTTTEAQPQNCWFLGSPNPSPGDHAACPNVNNATTTPGCGRWTKLLEYEVPPYATTDYVTGNGYIELKGARSGTWTLSGVEAARIEVAIEAVAKETIPKVTDWHWAQTYVPPGSSQIFFFADTMSWGHSFGQIVRVWIRKIDGCGSSAGPASFTVGKTYLQLRHFRNTNAGFYY